MTSAPYKPMTRKGYEKLHQEVEQLRRVERPRVVKGVADAAAEGDRSENAEYIYGKKRLIEIDKRLQYLSRLLDKVQVVDLETLSGDAVGFGATVEFETEDGKKSRYTLVGEGESDAREGTIAWSSPVGKALWGKRVHDVVEIERPGGILQAEITGIFWRKRFGG